jgi:hypothetical protein
MSPSQSHDTCHSLPAKLIPCPGFIVVFKKDALQDTIDKEADAVNQNGGEVKNKFDFILKVRNAVLDLRTYYL